MRVSWAVSATSQPAGVVEFTVSRHPVYNPAVWADVQAVLPLIHRNIASGTDAADLMTRAWDEVLDSLWAMGIRPGTIVGTSKLKRAVVYQSLTLCAEQYGEAFRAERDGWQKRAADCMAAFKSIGAVDEDEDAAIEEHERRSPGGGELYRA